MPEETLPPEIQARLRNHGIEVMAEAKGHLMLVRGECMVLVERKPAGLGSIGSTGLMTAGGLAFLVWREGREYLSAKGSAVEASDAQVEAVRAFSADVKTALA